MPITHSDRISGTIYVIAPTAEQAGDKAIDHLRNKNDAAADSFDVFDHEADADKALHNRYGSYDTDRDRVYAVSLDIRTTEQ